MPTDTPLGPIDTTPLGTQSATRHVSDDTKTNHKQFLHELSTLCETYDASIWAFGRIDGKSLFLERVVPDDESRAPKARGLHDEIKKIKGDVGKLWKFLLHGEKDEASPQDPGYTPTDSEDDEGASAPGYTPPDAASDEDDDAADLPPEPTEDAPAHPNMPVQPSPATSATCVPAHAAGPADPTISIPSMGQDDPAKASVDAPPPPAAQADAPTDAPKEGAPAAKPADDAANSDVKAPAPEAPTSDTPVPTTSEPAPAPSTADAPAPAAASADVPSSDAATADAPAKTDLKDGSAV